MATLTDADIKRPSQRTILAEVDNADYFVFEDVTDSKLKAITKTNIKETLGINANSTAISTLSTNKEDKSNKVTAFQPTPDDTHYPSEKLVADSLKAIKGVDYTEGTLKSHEDALATLNADDSTEGSVAKTVKDAVDLVKGTGWNGENLVDHEVRIGDLETNDTLQDATLGTLKETVLSTKLAVNELERQAQIGNGATLDFTGIGSVALDARATGRANPTIYGSTVGSDSIQLPARLRSVGKNLFDSDPEKFTLVGDAIIPMYRDGNVLALTLAGGYDNYYSRLITLNAGTYTLKSDANSETPIKIRVAQIEVFYSHDTSLTSPLLVLDFAGSINSTWQTLSNDFTIDSTQELLFVLRGKNSTYSGGLFQYRNIQLELGSTATPYEPYTDSTLYIADNEEVRSIQDVQDTLTMVNGEYIYTKKVSTPASVASGVAVNVTNYPTAKTGGKFAVELTAGGTQIGVIGTDSTSGAGTLRFELATPVTTNLLTSGTLKAFQNGTVYYDPYYEGSHQTNASSKITLPYEGTIEAVYGYDEDLVEYLLDSSEYSLTGTTLTITDALENEVFYVQMSRAEPLSPEMSVNVLNNDRVLLNPTNGKFYDYTIGVSGEDGALTPEFIFTEVV